MWQHVCLGRSVPETHHHVARTLSNQPPNTLTTLPQTQMKVTWIQTHHTATRHISAPSLQQHTYLKATLVLSLTLQVSQQRGPDPSGEDGHGQQVVGVPGAVTPELILPPSWGHLLEQQPSLVAAEDLSTRDTSTSRLDGRVVETDRTFCYHCRHRGFCCWDSWRGFADDWALFSELSLFLHVSVR